MELLVPVITSVCCCCWCRGLTAGTGATIAIGLSLIFIMKQQVGSLDQAF